MSLLWHRNSRIRLSSKWRRILRLSGHSDWFGLVCRSSDYNSCQHDMRKGNQYATRILAIPSRNPNFKLNLHDYQSWWLRHIFMSLLIAYRQNNRSQLLGYSGGFALVWESRITTLSTLFRMLLSIEFSPQSLLHIDSPFSYQVGSVLHCLIFMSTYSWME